MMKKSTKQLLSVLLAIVMVFGLMAPAMAAVPMMGKDAAVAEKAVEAPEANAVSTTRSTRGTTATLMAATEHKLVASEATNAGTVDNASQDAPAGIDSYFTLDSGVYLRNSSSDKSGTDYIYIDKAGGKGVSFTVTAGATAKVVIVYAADKDANTATAKLTNDKGIQAPDSVTGGKDSASKKNDDGTISATGGTGKATTVTFNSLAAGTYSFASTGGDGNVTTRLLSITVTEDGAASGGGDATESQAPASQAPASQAPAEEPTGGSWLFYNADAADIPSAAAVTAETKFNQTDILVDIYAGAGKDANASTANKYENKSATTKVVSSTGSFTYVDFIQGDTNAKAAGNASPSGTAVPVTGSYYRLVPQADGWIELAYRTNEKKSGWITELKDGTTTLIKDITMSSTTDTTHVFKVSEGTSYYICASGSKVGLFGVGFYSAANGEVKYENANLETEVVDAAAAVTATAGTDGKITVAVTGVKVGKTTADNGQTGADKVTTITTYGDEVKATLCDESGNAVKDGTNEIVATASYVKTTSDHTLTLTPKASGSYKVKVEVTQGKNSKAVSTTDAVSFTLPLAKPSVTAKAKAGNAIDVTWDAVAEADSYNVYMSTDAANKGEVKATVAKDATLAYAASGLTEGQSYNFWVEAVRGSEKVMSDAAVAIATNETPVEWTFAEFGENCVKDNKPTIGADANGQTVRIKASGNKFQTSSPAGEGISFYYTKLSTDTNFTLTAKVHVTSWSENNSQVAFGLLAADYVNAHNSSSKYISNMVFVGAADISKGAKNNDLKAGRIGIGAWLKHGAVTKGSDKDEAAGMTFKGYNLDTWILDHYDEIPSAITRYTVVGNNKTEASKVTAYQGGGTKNADGTWTGLTDFVFKLERNNMGYYVSYLDETGADIGPYHKPVKIYEPDALNQQDKNNIYVGLMGARNVDVTFSNIQLTTKNKADDTWTEEMEYDLVTPTLSMVSSTSTNHGDYHATFTSNVKGDLTWKINGVTMPKITIDTIQSEYPNSNSASVIRGDGVGTLKEGGNSVELTFTPWADDLQTLEPGQALEKITVQRTVNVSWDTTYKSRNNLYVSPNATAFGNGTKDAPMSLAQAIKYVQPGQKIILKEGTYTMGGTLTLPLGTDGLVDAPIYLMADPEATTRPVLDFTGRSGGVSLLGNYWYLYGFDIANSLGTGLQIGGSYNTVDSLNLYRHGGSGLQISRVGNHNATMEYWPHDNLIWRCAAYLNADAGQAAADGFANKETSGMGNVFRDCVSAYNSDDGWDFYSKTGNGSIGDVVIDHCVSYRNAYIEKDGVVGGELVKGTGGGNGFKMGGDNMASQPNAHLAKNSFAFENRNYGFTSNSTPTVHLQNVVAYNNSGSNVNLYSDKTKNFAVDGLVNINGGTTFNCTATNVKEAKASDVFVTTTFVDPINNADNSVKRDEDGYVDFGGFLTMKEGAAVADVFPKVEAIEYPCFSDNVLPDFLTIEEDVLGGTDTGTGDRGNGDRGDVADSSVGGGTDTDTPVTADTVTVEKTETAVKADGTKVTTSTLSNGSTAVKEVAPDGAVSVEVTAKTGEKIVDIDVPAEIPAAETKFEDVAEDHWAASAIDRMAGLGLVRGTGDGSYDTDGEVTRGTLATMLFRLANGAEGKTTEFADVAKDSWYASAIGWAAEAGVVTGYSETTFGPDDQLTREQMAVMLLRFAKLIGMDANVDSAAVANYADANAVNAWAADGMAWCVKNGIINGTSESTLSPAGSATRAQTAVMLDRFIGLLSK